MSRRKPPFRDGKVNVCSQMCGDCVFRPGNLMNLNPGRLKELVDKNLKADTGLICHQTIYGQDERGEALCRGFYDRYGAEVTPLRMAAALEVVAWQEPKPMYGVEVCNPDWRSVGEYVTQGAAAERAEELLRTYGTASVRVVKLEA